jgi:hypothetical protein
MWLSHADLIRRRRGELMRRTGEDGDAGKLKKGVEGEYLNMPLAQCCYRRVAPPTVVAAARHRAQQPTQRRRMG